MKTHDKLEFLAFCGWLCMATSLVLAFCLITDAELRGELSDFLRWWFLGE